MLGGNAKTDKGDIFYPSLKKKQQKTDTLWIPSWFPAAVSVFQLGRVRFDTQAQNWRGIWMQGHAKGLYIQQESCRGVWVQGVVVWTSDSIQHSQSSGFIYSVHKDHLPSTMAHRLAKEGDWFLRCQAAGRFLSSVLCSGREEEEE